MGSRHLELQEKCPQSRRTQPIDAPQIEMAQSARAEPLPPRGELHGSREAVGGRTQRCGLTAESVEELHGRRAFSRRRRNHPEAGGEAFRSFPAIETLSAGRL